MSFAVETTLSGRTKLGLIHKAKACGYEVHLIFIALNNPERCISRVKNRAARGGHSVPDEDVRRRYAGSIANAVQALRESDVAKFYDNTGDRARLILEAREGKILWQAEPLPAWLKL